MSAGFTENETPWRQRLAYYTEGEVALGCHYTVRLGVNPGELLDFLLGWTTLDIYGDDLEHAKRSSKGPVSAGKENITPRSEQKTKILDPCKL